MQKRLHSICGATACLIFIAFRISAATFYVNQAGTNPVPPYSDWTTAATNIQDAIDASSNGDQIWLTNGVYQYGGRSMDGMLTNRISLNKQITVQSVKGPSVTIVQGAFDPTSIIGPAAIRCAWLTNNATLSGFTLQGGATLAVVGSTAKAWNEGGAVYATSNNAIISYCVLQTNYAPVAGGAFAGTLNYCTIAGNTGAGAIDAKLNFCVLKGNQATNSTGGGADHCGLDNCIVIGNYASSGGGVYNCTITNSLLIGNSAVNYGGGAYGGTLINCAVVSNISSSAGGFGGGVVNAALTNCIVFYNSIYPSGSGWSNYNSCTFGYSDTAPLPAGTGNISVNPQFLADGYHLSATSPCIGAGTASVVSGTDIDGQPWNNPPSIGADEWQPAPVVSSQFVFQAGFPAHALTFLPIVAGQSPFTFLWSRNGVPIQDDGHHTNSTTANLRVNNFGPQDAGSYQLIASNAFGLATSQVAQVVIHTVDASGTNPAAPYTTWTTAATNIQDAINVASAGEIVLVTNGVYAYGGAVVTSNLTNRAALTKPLTVISVNGYSATTIQGAFDPVSTNGPGAVRCAYLVDGALLNGFTVQNGATRTNGDNTFALPLESGGGVYCTSSNGIVQNCFLTNNSAVDGGGIAFGTLNNSLVAGNFASLYGGGAYTANLNNCTVVNNYLTGGQGPNGAGTYNSIIRNSIVLYNFYYPLMTENNFGPSPGFANTLYTYCCTDPPSAGTGDIDANPAFLDAFHISSTSPCVGAGSNLYASGYDLDGEPWNTRPSIGCDEVVAADLTGPLALNLTAYQNSLLVNRVAFFSANFTGRVSYVTWSFGDGSATTNFGANANHAWTNAGYYPVTVTAYNTDNPLGVSATVTNQALPLIAPQILSVALLTNGFQFQFPGQSNANYVIQYATNLIPPAKWNTLQNIYSSPAATQTITDASKTNAMRFYRVLVQ